MLAEILKKQTQINKSEFRYRYKLTLNHLYIPDIISKTFSIDQLIDLHTKSQKKMIQLYKTLIGYGWNETIDARIIPVKLIFAGIESKLIILLLIKENFTESCFWDSFNLDKPEEKEKMMNDKLYFIQGDLKGELYIKLCMQLEHFIRMVAESLNINVHKINALTKQFIKEIGIDIEFKNLINLINYTRNTIHYGGIHTQNDITVSYKGKDYNFKKGEHISFFYDEFLHFLIDETASFIEQVCASQKIKSITEIRHSYSTFTWINED